MRERDKNWNLHHFGGLRTLGIITINDRMCVNINFLHKNTKWSRMNETLLILILFLSLNEMVIKPFLTNQKIVYMLTEARNINIYIYIYHNIASLSPSFLGITLVSSGCLFYIANIPILVPSSIRTCEDCILLYPSLLPFNVSN